MSYNLFTAPQDKQQKRLCTLIKKKRVRQMNGNN